MIKSNITFAIVIFLLTFLLNACEEVGPSVDFTPVDESLLDTTYIDAQIPNPQLKVVLLEDFTGVQCVNCPLGHKESEDLLAAYPNRLAVVGLHNYFQGSYAFSKEDYRTEEAFDLNNFLGPTNAWPVGVIDRKSFSGSSSLLKSVDKWETHVEEQLLETTPVNLNLSLSYDDASRELTVLTDVRYTEDVSSPHALSVSILENEIIDAQLTPSGIDTFYLHEHVLRDMMTPFTGTALDSSLLAGRVFLKEFKMALPEGWNESHIEVVAFVHESGSSKQIVQAAKAKMP